MTCALFGKTPSKRDFIAPGVPRDFLAIWEPWMQAGLSSSQHALDRGWQEKFLTAPIWRFWLGAHICGTPCLGAFMPSLDRVGRYYPLTLLAVSPQGQTIAPPELDVHSGWFGAVENFLLDTLEVSATFDGIMDALAALPAPAMREQENLPAGISRLAPNCITAPIDDARESGVFAGLRAAEWESFNAPRSCFWTLGGPGFRPRALSAQGMPPPGIFTALLTGLFEPNTAISPA